MEIKHVLNLLLRYSLAIIVAAYSPIIMSYIV